MRGDAIRQGQEGLQPGPLAPPIERDVLPALGAGDHRTDRDHQDVDELMIAPARLAWILKSRKARCQALDHAARPRLHRTGNGQHGPQSTARPKGMREPCPGAQASDAQPPWPPSLPLVARCWSPIRRRTKSLNVISGRWASARSQSI